MQDGRTAWLQQEIDNLKSAGLYNHIRTLDSPMDAWVTIDGRRLLNFCANNYLGLANHPRITQAARDGIENYGVGPGAVRSIAGTTSLHVQLEQRLVVRYAHNDVADLRRVIAERTDYKRRLIITDGVFSMDGDIAPLDKIAEVAEEHGIMLMVDDAHGEGVLGRGGRGIVDHFGLHGRVDVEVGTLSKAFGVVGGLVAGKAIIIEWLRQRGRPFLFSSAMTAPDTAACIEAVAILGESTELIDRLWANAELFRKEMQAMGFNTGFSQTPIVPVMLGEASLAQQFSRRLFEEGVFAMAIGFPTVARGKARIRVMNSAAHNLADIEIALETFSRVGRELGVIS
ncbi:MAG: 8-amino-7-oxononanoate synthase [Anaerolineae bacterium]|nr:MAG: 8-amino-7-oxononanoate synthase [Anaerolineae bacterium]